MPERDKEVARGGDLCVPKPGRDCAATSTRALPRQVDQEKLAQDREQVETSLSGGDDPAGKPAESPKPA